MSSGSSSNPTINRIGKSGQDAQAPQTDHSFATSSVEMEVSDKPLLTSPPRRTGPAARVAQPNSPGRDSRIFSKEQMILAVSQEAERERMLHKLQSERLRSLGNPSPLDQRMHYLQQGHCLGAYDQRLRQHADRSTSRQTADGPKVGDPVSNDDFAARAAS